MVLAKNNVDEIDDIVTQVIASSLGIDPAEVDDRLAYHSIPKWDSTGHVQLMLALETAFDIKIQEHLIQELHNVRAIRAFLKGSKPQEPGANVATLAEIRPVRPVEPAQKLLRGLTNVCIDNTWISHVDGAKGVLEYRGHSIHDLVHSHSFEEVSHLLLTGHLPNDHELASFAEKLEQARNIAPPVLDLLGKLRTAHPVLALRTAVSALPALDANTNDDMLDAGIRLIAQIPLIIGAHHAIRSGREVSLPRPGSSCATSFLTLLFGREPDATETALIERSLILHADLAANPSAFAARVAISCNADMYAAVTAAISAFAGSLHGGAAEQVLKMIDEIGAPEKAQSYVSERWARNEPIMGFGHRVFRVEDPRVRHFREAAEIISRERGDMRDFEIVTAVAKAMAQYSRYGVGANVDLYAGLVYRRMGLPDDMPVPIFIAGRIVGWVAQALEQRASNILIYPLLRYVGENGRSQAKRADTSA